MRNYTRTNSSRGTPAEGRQAQIKTKLVDSFTSFSLGDGFAISHSTRSSRLFSLMEHHACMRRCRHDRHDTNRADAHHPSIINLSTSCRPDHALRSRTRILFGDTFPLADPCEVCRNNVVKNQSGATHLPLSLIHI